MTIKIDKPSTVYIAFTGEIPTRFNLYSKSYGLYYFRNVNRATPRIKFNICSPGIYSSSTPFDVVKIVPIELPKGLPSLPPYDRNDIKDFTIVDNPDLTGSPAQVYVKEGRIEKGKAFYSLPKPIRLFILLHEIGHFFYGVTDADIKKANAMPSRDAALQFIRKQRQAGEEKCDLFAMIKYLDMGYNQSMAYYSLSKVLVRSQDNTSRIKTLFNNIQKVRQNGLS